MFGFVLDDAWRLSPFRRTSQPNSKQVFSLSPFTSIHIIYDRSNWSGSFSLGISRGDCLEMKQWVKD